MIPAPISLTDLAFASLKIREHIVIVLAIV